jgi:hypothetical protein
MVATSIFFIGIIASKARLAASPPLASASVSTRGVILPAHAPFVLVPATLTFLAPMADDCVPVSIGLFLVYGCDLEGKGFAVLKPRPTVESDTRYADGSEFDSEDISRLAVGIVGRGTEDSADTTEREGFA